MMSRFAPLHDEKSVSQAGSLGNSVIENIWSSHHVDAQRHHVSEARAHPVKIKQNERCTGCSPDLRAV